jgi:hypothetical protein
VHQLTSTDLGHGAFGVEGVQPIDDVAAMDDDPISGFGGRTVEGEERRPRDQPVDVLD